MGLLKWLFLLGVSACLCQKDCTGVDCPRLNNCIEEVLEKGACCATCLQIGCKCEGYQYYDCVNAGYRIGRVPEGESYFVDFGSTECSCPQGGGRIGCHFIPCPELPPNCIDVSEPADGCTQCERVGCVYEGQKYEAGHSFHIDVCRVCHCPKDGGKLMCYPIPNCDPRKVHRPVLTTTTQENTAFRRQNIPVRNVFNHRGSSPLPKHFLHPHGQQMPPFRPSSSHTDDEETEDYDYLTTDSTESPVHGIDSPVAPQIISHTHSEKDIPLYQLQTRQQELNEKFGVHEGTTSRTQFVLQGTNETNYSQTTDKMENPITDDNKEAEFHISANDEELSQTHREQLQFSIYTDSTEEPSFFKDDNSPEAIEKSERDSFSLVKDQTDDVTLDSYEDSTYSGVTHSPSIIPTTTPQTTPETDVTTTDWQVTQDALIYPSRSDEVSSTERPGEITALDRDVQESDINMQNATESDKKDETDAFTEEQKMYRRNSSDTVNQNISGGEVSSETPDDPLEESRDVTTDPPVMINTSNQSLFNVDSILSELSQERNESETVQKNEEEEEEEGE